MKSMLYLFLTFLLVAGCTDYGEETGNTEQAEMRITAAGWPRTVTPGQTEILVLYPGGLTGNAVVTGPGVSGESPTVSVTTSASGLTLAVTGLLGDSRYNLSLTGLVDGNGTPLPDCHTDFHTGPVSIDTLPSVHSVWPPAGGTAPAGSGFAVVTVFTAPVLRDELQLCLSGPNGYRYLSSSSGGSGTDAAFVLSDGTPPPGTYYASLTGVRAVDGRYGTGTGFSFVLTTETGSETNRPSVLFSELCWQAFAGESGSEFIELYNPSSSPVDLGKIGARLYRNSGSGWSLMCDFSGDSHFSGTNRTRIIPAFGYLLITGERGIARWPGADCVLSASRMTMTGKDAFALTTGGTPESGQVLDRISFTASVGNVSDLVSPPGIGMSVERKAAIDATALDMGTYGIYHRKGNGWSSGNAADDFLPRSSPEPQSSRDGREIP